MADNVDITPGGGATVAADDVGGVLYQRVKIAHGADGSATDTSSSNPLPVSGPLTDTQLRAAAVPVSGPLTNTELRASNVPVSGPVTDAQLRASPVGVQLQASDSLADLWWMLKRIFDILSSPMGFDRSLSRQRVTGIIESGTVTTVTGVTTVTTVSTVTNLSQIDTRNGAMLINQSNLDAWGTCVRARIT